ncbi:MAG: hypothetical protein LBL27_02005 [Coriobacteriales bacterium]|nr:hypothetical protein [Coriobacteriales bacterium]
MRDYLEVLDKKSQRLKHLISDLLDASKAGSGNIPIQSVTLDLRELIGQIAGDFEEALEAASLEYVGPHESAATRVWVRADGDQLRRVLENLFSNAVKYSPPNTRLYVDIVEPAAGSERFAAERAATGSERVAIERAAASFDASSSTAPFCRVADTKHLKEATRHRHWRPHTTIRPGRQLTL